MINSMVNVCMWALIMRAENRVKGGTLMKNVRRLILEFDFFKTWK